MKVISVRKAKFLCECVYVCVTPRWGMYNIGKWDYDSQTI